tara:strand:+ start:108 stop:278 length:171 start_codon:yes stop_codon:yes gene_type:complete
MKKHTIIASIVVFAGSIISSWITGWVDLGDKLKTAFGISLVFYMLDAFGWNWGEKE